MTSADETLRRAVVEAALPEVPFEGWTLTLLRQACAAAGVDRAAEARLFPEGVGGLVAAWGRACDDAMRDALPDGFAQMKVRERIATAVRVRIDTMSSHKIAAQKAVQFFASPFQAARGLESLWATCDAIWRAAGDASADFNWYTKRGILAGVYASTLNVWFDDDSDGAQATWAFLDRRIADVMTIEKVKAQAQGIVAQLPSPLTLLGALRYSGGGRPRPKS